MSEIHDFCHDEDDLAGICASQQELEGIWDAIIEYGGKFVGGGVGAFTGANTGANTAQTQPQVMTTADGRSYQVITTQQGTPMYVPLGTPSVPGGIGTGMIPGTALPGQPGYVGPVLPISFWQTTGGYIVIGGGVLALLGLGAALIMRPAPTVIQKRALAGLRQGRRRW